MGIYMENHEYYKKYPHLIIEKFDVSDRTWLPIVEKLFEYANDFNSTAASEDRIYFVEVKEKYGSYRLYYFNGDEYFDGMVYMVEQLTSDLYKRNKELGWGKGKDE